jgi:undecaprenyl-diphosphatase
MSILHAIVLGIVQGLSEFLPISSSGHLALTQWALGWDDFEGNESLEQAFAVAVHIGTLTAVVAYFWRDLTKLAAAGVGDVVRRRRPFSGDGRLAWLLVLSAIPAAIAGVALGDIVEGLDDNIGLIGVMLIAFGLLLGWADNRNGRLTAGEWGARDAGAMGVAQALALQPGVSRSGATMTAALALGYQRTEAARLAFLMSVPVIAGAGLYEGAKVLAAGGLPSEYQSAFLAGFLSAAVTGWLAIWFTLKIVRTYTFRPFVIYRIVLGVLVLGAAATGVR